MPAVSRHQADRAGDDLANAPLDAVPRYVRAGAIVPRGDILKSNNNRTTNWAASLRIEF